MANYVIVLDGDGIRELLKSPDVRRHVQGIGRKIAKECGSGYDTRSFIGFDRANVLVRAKTQEAAKDNLQNNTLLRHLK